MPLSAGETFEPIINCGAETSMRRCAGRRLAGAVPFRRNPARAPAGLVREDLVCDIDDDSRVDVARYAQYHIGRIIKDPVAVV
jgi:hypothetical protein